MANACNFDDLLQDILLRLPVKSLVRFKSVSKQWHSLISDATFSRRVSPDFLGLVLYNMDPLEPDVEQVVFSYNSTNVSPLNHPFGSRLRRLQNACNGLMLMQLRVELNEYQTQFCVYNPTTRQSVALPPLLPDKDLVLGVNLVFDPTKSPHYNVVYVRICVSDPEISQYSLGDYGLVQIEIYSSVTRSWRASGAPFSDYFSTDFNHGVFCNGRIHWLKYENVFSIYFNVEDEKLGQVRTPSIDGSVWNRHKGVRQLGESRGHLHLIELHRKKQQLYVCEIESDCTGWFVKYQVDLNPLMVAFFPWTLAFDDRITVVGVVREADDEDSYMVLYMEPFIHSSSFAVRVCFKDGSFRRISDWILNQLTTYESTLLSLSLVKSYSLIQTLFPL